MCELLKQQTDEITAVTVTEITGVQVTEVEFNGEEIIEVEAIELEIIDIEEYARAQKPPCKAKHYRIKIDKDYYTVDQPGMTGRELLRLAKKLPTEDYQLLFIEHGGESKPIGLDEYLSFIKPGIERFITLPKDQTEG